jgi:hypothetical protein
LHFIFLSFDSSHSYLSCHSSSLFFFFFSFNHSHSFFYSFLLSFPYTYFSLYFPSLDIFMSLLKALNSSLSCINTILNLK